MPVFISPSGRTSYQLPRLRRLLQFALLAIVVSLITVSSLLFATDRLAGSIADKPGSEQPVAVANAPIPTTATAVAIPQIVIIGKRMTPAQKHQADEADVTTANETAATKFAGMQAGAK